MNWPTFPPGDPPPGAASPRPRRPRGCAPSPRVLWRVHYGEADRVPPRGAGVSPSAPASEERPAARCRCRVGRSSAPSCARTRLLDRYRMVAAWGGCARAPRNGEWSFSCGRAFISLGWCPRVGLPSLTFPRTVKLVGVCGCAAPRSAAAPASPALGVVRVFPPRSRQVCVAPHAARVCVSRCLSVRSSFSRADWSPPDPLLKGLFTSFVPFLLRWLVFLPLSFERS